MSDGVLAFCEPVHATARTHVHIREVGPEGFKYGGGIPSLALCGYDLRRGWDLRTPVTPDRMDPAAEVGPTCPACIEQTGATRGGVPVVDLTTPPRESAVPDHTLVVEHTDQGTEDSQGEQAYVFTVHYVIRHPEGEDFCPIEEHIRAVGIETTLGLGGRTPQLAEGLYALEYWSRHYSGPEGDDWDAGVNVHRLPEVSGG